MSASNTTVIFVPGAWHRPAVFVPVMELLQQAGYRTDAVDLPSVGAAEHLPNFDKDVAAIRQQLQTAIAAGQRVVVVPHSYAGIPACEAIQGLPTAPPRGDDDDGVAKGYIAHLFFAASFVIPAQASLFSTLGNAPLPWFRVSADELEVNPATPEAIFYNDVPAARAAAEVARLAPQSYRAFHSPLTYEAWRHVPATYLYCARDNAIPPSVQRMMVEQTAAGVPFRTEEIDAGHSPFLSRPEEFAASVRRAAEL